jgi:hypothetical protein
MPQGPIFDPLSKVLVVIREPQQRVFSLRIILLTRENARLFCAGAPVVGVINEGFASHARPPIRRNFVTAEQKIRSAM